MTAEIIPLATKRAQRRRGKGTRQTVASDPRVRKAVSLLAQVSLNYAEIAIKCIKAFDRTRGRP